MHYTFEQLKAHAEIPVPDIGEHLKTCSACYETSLLVKLTVYQSTLPQNATPSAQFLKNLESVLAGKPRSRRLSFRKPSVWLPVLAAALFLLALNLFFFRSEAAMQLSFIEGMVTINGNPASPKQKIATGDKIKTAEEALAVINLGNRADITLMPGTEISITATSTANLPETNIHQHSGYTFNRVMKGKTRFILSTDNFDVIVRGTQFGVDLNHADGRVKLVEGQLDLRRGESRTGLVAGYKIQMDNGKFFLMQDLASYETAFAENFRSIPFPAPVLRRDVDVPSEKIEALLHGEDEPWTLAEIRRKYKRISAIYTRSGQRYIGGFYSGNAMLKVQTVTKKIKISSNDVDKIIPFD